MTEQKTNKQTKTKQPTKQERIKAKIGAWWKSTVTEKVNAPESPASQKSQPSKQSAADPAEHSPSTEKPEKSQINPSEEVEEKTKKDGVSSQRTSQQKMEGKDSSAEVAEKDNSELPEERSKKMEDKSSVSSTIHSDNDQQTKREVEQDVTDRDSELGESPVKEQGDELVEKTEQRQDARKNRRKRSVRQESQDDDVPEEEEQTEEPKPITKLLINAEEPEECRLALLENGQLESIHVATSTRVQTKNNIYKARIVAIEPNLQAAFVDYGTEKNGFLPFSEIHPEYYKENVSDKVQELINQHQWKKLSITDVMERGREVLVQVVKEEVGKKGANMTTYLSLPGRCVVLMPGSDSKGISRKISGEERRTKLRDHMLSLKIPEGIGWIVRTASIDITKAALGRDVNYLLRLWEEVKKKGQDLDGVGLIYQDHDHVLRFLREHFDPDLQEILVDDKDAFEQVKGFIEMLPAKQRSVKCKLHRGARPIFNQYSIEDQIESIYQPKVNLPSGGSIVIDPTEALVAIDVNSGSTSKGRNFEESIYQANMEAAKELARQLRLRDLGGLIVVDFIDMRSKKHIRDVERQVKTAMKRDKAKVDISRISKFGLMQISRQKLGAPIEAGNYRVCTHCKGRGIVRSVETLALFYLRRIHTAASRKTIRQVECHFPVDVAGYLLNNKRNELIELESKYNTELVITADPSFGPGDNEILFHKNEKAGTEKNKS